MTDSRQLKDDIETLSEDFLDGLSSQIELVHRTHSIAEEGVWSDCSPGVELEDLRNWGATSLPRIARIQTEFWRGMFGLYRDQAQQTADVLRGRMTRYQGMRKKRVRVHFSPTGKNRWTASRPLEVRNRSGIEFSVKPPETVLLRDAEGSLWPAKLEPSQVQQSSSFTVALALKFTTPDKLENACFPMRGEADLELHVKTDPSAAISHTLEMHIAAPEDIK